VFDLPELAVLASKFNRMAEVLDRSREQNRQLARQTLAIQEDERRALAHELHDELGQSISAINAVAASIAQSGSAGAAAATIAEISSRMYAVVRGMLRRLRPVLLDEFGLVRALQDLVDGWNDRHADAFCRLTVRGSFDDFGDALKVSVYRIIQECLTNASKHAAASEVTVDLERTAGAAARLRVADDGVGFEPATAPAGLGLLGMRERVDALRGTFALTAAPGRGVRIAIELPAHGGQEP
jgi:two-component system sensor histidine kinase UhpB